ncbi:protein phosphatase 2C domain-containing protein [Saccharopolyspora sp. K220]|uniref:protein phosphatase 2C domain-containing protein n=1 Tax=Saccharopolyspora soli TaxID=2926618 RepID=UPI001F55E3E2|nr:protein phosphatase 2C domain-containing protein [Saccharopolyspora soli]MCI2420262.1 protein phosphatase 2C domain-containing protein [Saccharopolyspora soli]
MNEDYAVTGPDWAFVLDGATAASGVDSGCVHDVRWLVRRLGGELAQRLAVSDETAPDVLAEAIQATGAAHADTCDLRNPSSPSTTVALLRLRGDDLEYLVLADSPIVLDVAGEIRPIIDDRLEHLPSYTVEAVRELRNRPGGFWVASTEPAAAYQSVRDVVPVGEVRRAALLSDGASRYVERFGLADWAGLMDLVDQAGPAELLRRVRAAEQTETPEERSRHRGKPHDDATALFVRF